MFKVYFQKILLSLKTKQTCCLKTCCKNTLIILVKKLVTTNKELREAPRSAKC